MKQRLASNAGERLVSLSRIRQRYARVALKLANEKLARGYDEILFSSHLHENAAFLKHHRISGRAWKTAVNDLIEVGVIVKVAEGQRGRSYDRFVVVADYLEPVNDPAVYAVETLEEASSKFSIVAWLAASRGITVTDAWSIYDEVKAMAAREENVIRVSPKRWKAAYVRSDMKP